MSELFKNENDALKFCFHYSNQRYAQSPMAKMMQVGAVGFGRGLSALDGAGQAGLIRAQVEKLSPVHKACITARFSPRYEECACCGSRDKALQEYKEAIATLGNWALSTFTGLSARVAREYVIRSYFEKGLSLKLIIDRAEVGKSTLYDYKSKIVSKLKDVDHQAQLEMSNLLSDFIQKD